VAREQVAGRRLGDLFPGFDDAKSAHRLDQVFDAGAPVVLSAQFHGQVIPLRFPDGRNRIHQATVTSIPAPEGERWALFVIHDVTDLTLQVQAFRSMREQAVKATSRVQAAKQLAERRNEQVAEVNRDLEQFAYLASHDLQEPLRTLTSFSTFLRADLGEDLPAAAATRMRRLIKDLLALSRVSRSEMSWSNTTLQSCLAEALDALAVRVGESGMSVRGGEELPDVVGDRRLLTQLFQNLLGNAMKFADASRPPVIEIAPSRLSNGWQISVSDNGIGIPEQYSTKVFEPFQRLHGADKYPGSGMGLAICKRAVERHGGTIWTEAREQGGACFKFTLMDEHDES
jgi:signal transduction histidine kinase